MAENRTNPLLLSVALVVVLGALTAAQVAPTEVRGHVLGETVTEYMKKAAHPNPTERCQSFLADSKAAKKDKNRSEWCDKLLGIATGGTGRIEIAEEPSIAGARCVPLIRIAKGEGSLWCESVIDNGRLAVVRLFLVSPYSQVLSDLVAKYGQPSRSGTTTLQNAYGATLQVGEAYWQMPDGTVITAKESASWMSGGYQRNVAVDFLSKDEVDIAAKSDASHTNPFGTVGATKK
jgi:hypothetical protein